LRDVNNLKASKSPQNVIGEVPIWVRSPKGGAPYGVPEP
jgi:hypothetical protein